MAALILVFVVIMLYFAFKVIPKKIKLRNEHAEQERKIIEAKIRAENFKKKVWMAKRLK